MDEYESKALKDIEELKEDLKWHKYFKRTDIAEPNHELVKFVQKVNFFYNFVQNFFKNHAFFTIFPKMANNIFF